MRPARPQISLFSATATPASAPQLRQQCSTSTAMRRCSRQQPPPHVPLPSKVPSSTTNQMVVSGDAEMLQSGLSLAPARQQTQIRSELALPASSRTMPQAVPRSLQHHLYSSRPIATSASGLLPHTLSFPFQIIGTPQH